ncbi:MAG: hypothetical protein ACD_60C00022G0018 [uncultured bacterium]|nr:MAG: hypothetical protein ACD_60C00022G0018 [uncultured bacterium]
MDHEKFSLPHLANHLIREGVLKESVAHEAVKNAKTDGIPLISYLIKHKIISSEEMVNHFQKMLKLPRFDLAMYDKNWLKHSPISINFIRQYRIIPLNKIDFIFYIGLSDPTDQGAIDAVTFHTRLRIVITIIAENQMAEFIQNYCKEEVNKDVQLNLMKQIDVDNKIEIIEENNFHLDEPLIKFVDNIILLAFKQRASDIHIEPYEQYCRIRYRQHGMLYSIHEIPGVLAARITTRLKVMAKLDIAERRLPQDGRFQVNSIDIRINTCPTFYGEKIVLRLLNTGNISLEIDELGLSFSQKKQFLHSISQPQGLILVTGPTGSGKTMTLYTALHYLNNPEKNISTVEDPIEIRLHGINQVNINPKIGLYFKTVLRALLRQDPDILMVGEIRDKETADIAIQAAQTGHLVFSTLHTNSAIETLVRLETIGVPSYHLAGSLTLIIAQRLVRKLCMHCRQIDATFKSLAAEWKIEENIYCAKGCEKCSHGYTERTAIYEFLPITESIAQLIGLKAKGELLLKKAEQENFISLKKSGIEKIAKGITSVLEINRVLSL